MPRCNHPCGRGQARKPRRGKFGKEQARDARTQRALDSPQQMSDPARSVEAWRAAGGRLHAV